MDVCGPLWGYSEFMKFILTRPRLSSLCYEGFEFSDVGNGSRVRLTDINNGRYWECGQAVCV